MKSEKQAGVGIACGIFRKEIEALREQKLVDISFSYLVSMLHMQPAELDKRLQAAIEKGQQNGDDIILVYGDCCPHMHDFESAGKIVRTAGMNCCEIMLGRELYRQLRSEGAFFLMPEWTLRWREVFQRHIGLEGENARSYMTEMHSKLTYIDSGLNPIPESHLHEISDYTGLPVEIREVALDHLLAAIRDADGKRKTP